MRQNNFNGQAEAFAAGKKAAQNIVEKSTYSMSNRRR
jgi:hypothetical protein